MVISDHEKKNTAYHEAGHTIVGLNLPKADPVHKVSIIPRGGALGVTQTLPEEDILNLSSERANTFISFLMGGRCAEELIFNERTNGASNDIERATELARSMVCQWGMSDMGPIAFGKAKEHPFAGMGDSHQQLSEVTAQRIDAEVRKIIESNYERSLKILQERKEQLITLAETLIVWETLDRHQIDAVLEGKDIGRPIISVKKTDSASSSSSSTPDDKVAAPLFDQKEGPATSV
jgi:cell division protease FtsH